MSDSEKSNDTSPPTLEGYLLRIGYQGDVAPTLECLRQLHLRHALTIPYENLDFQLNRVIKVDIPSIFHKIVARRRGGVCHEVHRLFRWVLSEIGFESILVGAGVDRREQGDDAMGNHSLVLVRLDGEYHLADLGLGDGIREPIPLVEGAHRQGGLIFRLERLDDGYWRYHNHQFALPASFDFREEAADEQWIIERLHYFSTDKDSMFVQNLFCQIMSMESVLCLTGRFLLTKTLRGKTKTLISEDSFERILADTFGLRHPEAMKIWPRVAARHRLLFGDADDEIVFQGFDEFGA